MSVRYSCVAWAVAVLAGTSTAGRAQGFDVASQPLDGIEDLPVEAPLAAAANPSGFGMFIVDASGSQGRVPRPRPRNYEVRIGADLDDDKRYGTYLGAVFKRDVLKPQGLLALVPNVMIRGDNLSSAAMGTQALRFDGTLSAVLTPQRMFDRRLQLAVIAGGSYMATEDTDTQSLGIGVKASIALCPLLLCLDHEQLRIGASFNGPSVGSDSYKLDFAYALRWRYDNAPTPGASGTVSPKRIAATPFVSLKDNDAGWATTLGMEVGFDVTLEIRLAAQVLHTLKGGAASVAANQGGIYLSYHPGG
jgi:hypothetical protein